MSSRHDSKEDSRLLLMSSREIVSNRRRSLILSVACTWLQRRGKKFAAIEPRKDPVPWAVQPCAPGTVPFPEGRGWLVCACVCGKRQKNTGNSKVPFVRWYLRLRVSSSLRLVPGACEHRIGPCKINRANRYCRRMKQSGRASWGIAKGMIYVAIIIKYFI